MKALRAAVLISALLTGCTAMMMGNPNAQNLTPDQVKAYQDAGQDTYGCIKIGGPPPAGNTIWLVVPHGVKVDFKIGDDCHILQP